MKFGKLPDLTGVDFILPPAPPANAARWERMPARPQTALTLYIGATGWGMPQWKGKWYPLKTRTSDFLTAYSQQFNTIELNTTHYRTPTVEQVEKWTAAVPADFRFCPKVLQRISHSNDLGLGGADIPDFTRAIGAFGEKLGCSFIQLPPYFSPDRWPVLERFLRAWPRELPLAIELRHEDWFKGHQNWNRLTTTLEVLGHYLVITDVAGRRDVLHMEIAGATSMLRFVGNDHPSDRERVDHWVTRLDDWAERGLHTVYMFTHRPDNLTAPELAQILGEALKEKTNISTRYPKPIETDTATQMSLF